MSAQGGPISTRSAGCRRSFRHAAAGGLTVAALVVAVSPGIGQAQTVAVGSEFQVNTCTDDFFAAYFKAEGARYDALVIANPDGTRGGVDDEHAWSTRAGFHRGT